MNFGQLKTQVSTWLDDLNFGYFTESQVERWLNNAQYECQKLLIQAGQNYYVKCFQTTLVSSQNEYVLPQDFLVLHRLALVASGSGVNQSVYPLAFITLNQQDLVETGSGDPAYYYIKRNRLVLYPVPISAKTLQLFYSPLVNEMTLDTDTPDIPVQYHEYLAVLATVDGFLKDGRSDAEMLRKKEAIEKPLKELAELRRADSPRAIITTGEYSGNSDFLGF